MDARAILERLVGFPTVSRDSNLAIVDWIEDYLADHGVTAHRVYDDSGQKASIFANVGPEVPGGVVLSGHTDVVPVDGQDWSSDPWTLVEREGRLYGRGVCDMKGFNALALAAVPRALAAGINRPLQIAFSYDEEVGLLGAPGLAAAMRERLPEAAAVLIGEPTRMKVVSGHKGCDAVEVHVRGFEVHSSMMHQGVSAVLEAARLIDWVRQRSEANRAAEPGPVAAMFEPPYTTLHVGVVQGGTAHNITAKDCRFTIDIRTTPDDDVELWIDRIRAEAARISGQMQAVHPGTGIEVALTAPGPGVRPEENGAAEALARQLTGDNTVNTVPYGTDGGHFQNAGYSVVVCGPGNIAQAHQPDEYIEIAEFERGRAFLDRLVAHLAG